MWKLPPCGPSQPPGSRSRFFRFLNNESESVSIAIPVRNEVRVVSDLAVKAAADTLARTGGDEVAALAAARFVASNNTVAGKNLTLGDDDVIFGRAYKQNEESLKKTFKRLAGSAAFISKYVTNI